MSSKQNWIVKIPLQKLRVKEDWVADRSRVLRETSCLKIIAKYVGQEYAPRVLYEDRDDYACALECAPDGTRTWKEDLLEERIDPKVTKRVAIFLSRFHSQTQNTSLKQEFFDITNFLQLRIQPYLDEICKRYPDLKIQVNEISSGLTTVRLCLVHGDFSPKNILILPDRRIWIIDAEVAHFGNPAFDIAFCTNHLVLKAIHLHSPSCLDQARAIWNTYWMDSEWSEQETFAVRVLGALMLARVDGKSPVEYLNEANRNIVRELSVVLVKNRIDDFEYVIDQFRKNT